MAAPASLLLPGVTSVERHRVAVILVVVLLVLAVAFLAFSVRGGAALRGAGWFCLVVGVLALFSPKADAGEDLLSVALGVVLLAVGHWAYAFAYFHYKSPRAERLVEGGIMPRLRVRPGLYLAQGPVASALREGGAGISRRLLGSASGVEKARPPAAPGHMFEPAPAGGPDATSAPPADGAAGRFHRTLAAVGERIGVSRRRHDRLRESLAEERALGAELRGRLDGLEVELREQAEVFQARDRAREDRLEAVLADAATFVGGLDRSISAIVAQVSADGVDEHEIAVALQAMLAGRARSVSILPTVELSRELRTFVEERGGVTTWMRDDADDAGEHPLEMTAALVGGRAILVGYADGVYDDGRLGGLVEDLCHAVAASLEGRYVAREKGRRLPVSLLGDGRARQRLAALRETQGSPSATIVVRIAEDAYEQLTGAFGEPAWNAELFNLASELDGAARAVGGEVFEIGRDLVCLLPPGQRAGLRERFAAVVARSGIRAEVLDA